MTDEPREWRSGETLSEYIKQVANELPVDAVGMWQIVPGGRHGFGLEGEALTGYVRRCIAELLSRGAVPVIVAAARTIIGSRRSSMVRRPKRSSRMLYVNGWRMGPRTKTPADCGS